MLQRGGAVVIRMLEDVKQVTIGPLIERTIEVSKRLLASKGIVEGDLTRVVMVGGPTVMPFLRHRVRDALGADFGEGLDPMTLVSEGAALYAVTANLEASSDARPIAANDMRPS